MAAVLEQVRWLEQWLWLRIDHDWSRSHGYSKCAADRVPQWQSACSFEAEFCGNADVPHVTRK